MGILRAGLELTLFRKCAISPVPILALFVRSARAQHAGYYFLNAKRAHAMYQTLFFLCVNFVWSHFVVKICCLVSCWGLVSQLLRLYISQVTLNYRCCIGSDGI